MTKKFKSDVITIFKNRPLVRSGNTIYYGNVSDKFIVKIDIAHEKDKSSSTATDNVTVQLLDASPDVDIRKRLMKRCKRCGLYEALDVADAWLNKTTDSFAE